jgi:hypothetical protein
MREQNQLKPVTQTSRSVWVLTETGIPGLNSHFPLPGAKPLFNSLPLLSSKKYWNDYGSQDTNASDDQRTHYKPVGHKSNWFRRSHYLVVYPFQNPALLGENFNDRDYERNSKKKPKTCE